MHPHHAIQALVMLALAAGAAPCGAQRRDIEGALGALRSGAAGAGATEQAERLGPAEAAARAGRSFLSLHLAREPWADVKATLYVRATSPTAARDSAAFDAEWRRMGESISKRARPPGAAARVPAAVRALAQVSRQQSGPFYEGGRLYGQNTTLENGLYYVGLADAYVEFASFLEGLPFPGPKPPPAIGALTPAIARLEAATVDAYERAGEKERRRFIELNVALKVASECEARGWREGALYETLDAARALGLAAGPGAVPSAGAVRQELARVSARLAASPADQSIGLLFVEMAQASLDGLGQGAPDATAEAAVIVRDVMPLYAQLVTGEKP